jgi:GNAT superfamily N-acetyltransferase
VRTPTEFQTIAGDSARDPEVRAQLLDMWVAVIDAGGSVGFTPPAPVEAVGRTLDRSLARVVAGTDALGVLRADRRIVGMGLLVDAGSPLRRHWRTVLRVMVRPEHQGRGAGPVLMRGLHAHARELGLEQLQLTVRGGQGLEAFYTRLGYAVVGCHPGAIRVGPGDDRDEVMLVVRLA